jgi:hypothetical protein
MIDHKARTFTDYRRRVILNLDDTSNLQPWFEAMVRELLQTGFTPHDAAIHICASQAHRSRGCRT